MMLIGNPFSHKGFFDHSHLFALGGRGEEVLIHKMQRTIDSYLKPFKRFLNEHYSSVNPLRTVCICLAK